jgi:hypothetical protein
VTALRVSDVALTRHKRPRVSRQRGSLLTGAVIAAAEAMDQGHRNEQARAREAALGAARARQEREQAQHDKNRANGREPRRRGVQGSAVFSALKLLGSKATPNLVVDDTAGNWYDYGQPSTTGFHFGAPGADPAVRAIFLKRSRYPPTVTGASIFHITPNGDGASLAATGEAGSLPTLGRLKLRTHLRKKGQRRDARGLNSQVRYPTRSTD